jgi:cell division initiation protein
MKITPIEIKQQQFEKSLRGFDVAEVQSFLTLVSNEYENLITKNQELEEQIEKLSDRVKHYERVEEALHETLQTTKESVAQKMDNARLEAKNLVDKAHLEAESVVKEAHHEKAHIRQSILRLLDKRQEIIMGISSYLENASSTISKFKDDEMKIFSLDKEAAPSTPEPATEVQKSDEEKNEEQSPNTRFAFDDEAETDSESESDIDTSFMNSDDDSYPPGSERLDDILDEID